MEGPSLPPRCGDAVLLWLGRAKLFDVKDAQTAIIPCAKEVQPQQIYSDAVECQVLACHGSHGHESGLTWAHPILSQTFQGMPWIDISNHMTSELTERLIPGDTDPGHGSCMRLRSDPLCPVFRGARTVLAYTSKCSPSEWGKRWENHGK